MESIATTYCVCVCVLGERWEEERANEWGVISKISILYCHPRDHANGMRPICRGVTPKLKLFVETFDAILSSGV